jgi:dolichol-phosphate mannosyltransferase
LLHSSIVLIVSSLGRRRIVALTGSGATAMAVDLVVFEALSALRVDYEVAQLFSFAASAAFILCQGVLLKPRGGQDSFDASLWRQCFRFLCLCLMTLSLRAGLLALAVTHVGLPPQLAMLPTAAVAAFVNVVGGAFYVRPVWRTAAPPAERWHVAAIGIVLLSFALRLAYLGQTPLLPNEAYYWDYAQHLDYGYLDHPPMIALAIALGTRLFGDSEFGVRILGLACSLLTVGFGFALANSLYGRSAAFVAALAIAVLPYYFCGAIVMEPDVLLAPAWAAALYYFERALRHDRRAAWWGVGFAMGLGLLSKYTIALLAPSALVVMILEPRLRRQLARPGPYLAALLALLLFSPVIYWNARNQWASFEFQTVHRLASGFNFGFPKLALYSALLLSPLGLLGASLALVSPPESARTSERQRFVIVFTVLPLAVFIAFSLGHATKLVWTGPVWLGVLPALAATVVSEDLPVGGFREKLDAGLRRAWSTNIAALLLLFAVSFYYLSIGLPGVPYPDSLRGLPLGWPDFGRQIAEVGARISRQTGKPPVYVGMDSMDLASEVAFYAHKHGDAPLEVASNGLSGGDGLMFDRWISAANLKGRNLVLAYDLGDSTDWVSFGRACGRLGAPRLHRLTFKGQPVGSFLERTCFDYLAPRGTEHPIS